MIAIAHVSAAAWTGLPYLQLEDAEAERLGKAIERVLRIHGLRALSPTAQAYWVLGSALAGVYGPRLAYHNQLRAEAAAAASATVGAGETGETTVIPMPGPLNGSGSAPEEAHGQGGTQLAPELVATIERGE